MNNAFNRPKTLSTLSKAKKSYISPGRNHLTNTRTFENKKVPTTLTEDKNAKVDEIVKGIIKNGVLSNKQNELDGEKEYVLKDGVYFVAKDLVFLANNMRVRELKTQVSNTDRIRSVKALVAFVTLINQGQYLELNSWGKVKEYLSDHSDILIYMIGNIPALLIGGRIKRDAFEEFRAKYESWILSPNNEREHGSGQTEPIEELNAKIETIMIQIRNYLVDQFKHVETILEK